MAKTDEPWTQLATRIPKSLHRELKLHCVHADTSVMDFVVAALKEKLARQGRGGRRTRDEESRRQAGQQRVRGRYCVQPGLNAMWVTGCNSHSVTPFMPVLPLR